MAARRAPVPSSQMREHKAAATTAGVLYITGTVAGVLSKVVGAPVRDAGDPLAAAAEHSGAVVTSGLLVLVMGLSLAFIPVVLFPVLRRVDEVLAIGYLIVRGAVETACYVVLAIGWLLLAPLGEVMSAGPGTASPAGVRLGSLMIDSEATSAVLTLVFCLGAVIFYVLLYRSRIVPRWIALWGLLGIPFYVAADVLAVYAAIGVDSTAQNLLFAPIFVQEMVLAAWMIARGFRPAAPSTGREAASSPKQPRSFLLGAARGSRVARARRIVMPLCGAGAHYLVMPSMQSERLSKSSRHARHERASEAPPGRTRCVRSIGVTSARASPRSERARAASRSQ